MPKPEHQLARITSVCVQVYSIGEVAVTLKQAKGLVLEDESLRHSDIYVIFSVRNPEEMACR